MPALAAPHVASPASVPPFHISRLLDRDANVHEVRSHPISDDSAVLHARLNMQGDDPVDDGSRPIVMGDGTGIPFPLLGWNGTIPSGKQVCSSSDEDGVRICCTKGDVKNYNRHAMCLRENSVSAAQEMYDCIAKKTMIDRKGGIGVACNAGGNITTFVTKDGVSQPKPQAANDKSFNSKNSGSRLAVRLGVVASAAAMLLTIL